MQKIEHILTTTLITLVSVLFFGLGIRSGNRYLTTIPVLFSFAIFALNKPSYLFLAGIALWQSSLVLPGFPNELQLYHIFLFVASVIILLRIIITKEAIVSDSILRLLTFLYGFVTFYTMLARGIGFNVLGSDQIGGMRYVFIFVGVMCIWFLPNISISVKKMQWALYFYMLFSFIPVLAELTFILSGGRIFHQYYFVRIGSGLGHTFMAAISGEGARFTSAVSLARALLVLPFILVSPKARYFLFYFLFVSLAVLASAFTGFRTSLAETGLIVFISFYFLFRHRRKEYLLASVVFVAFFYIFSLLFFDYLPFGFQRMLSFLPGIQSTTDATIDAFASTDFRLGVWRLGVQEIPNHLLLGKGLTYSASDFYALQMYGLPGRHYEIGLLSELHHGPLEVLVNLGLAGFVLFTLFTIRICFLVTRILRFRNVEDKYNPLIIFLSSWIFVRIMMFWLSFGNPHNSFLQIIVSFIMLDHLSRSSHLKK